MIIVIQLLALLEIWWDWRLIEKKHKSPNYTGSNILRIVIAIILCIAWPIIFKMPHQQWLFSPVMIFFNFWFIFDYGLNAARNKAIQHLGTNRIDMWQKEHGGEMLWFWIKLALAYESVVVYYNLG